MRTREHQYDLVLKRDLICDYFSDLANATINLKRGYISDINSPYLFNRENFECNQIKQDEVLLKDKLGCKWLVGYWNKDAVTEKKKFTASKNAILIPDYRVGVLADLPFNTTSSYFCLPEVYIRFNYRLSNTTEDRAATLGLDSAYSTTSTESNLNISSVRILFNPLRDYDDGPAVHQGLLNYYNSLLGAIPQSQYDNLLNYENKIVLETSTNSYYKVVVNRSGIKHNQETFSILQSNPNYSPVKSIVNKQATVRDDSDVNFRAFITSSQTLTFTLDPVDNEEYFCEVDPVYMNTLRNEAYNAFAIPLPEKEIFLKQPDGTLITGLQNTTAPFIMAQSLLAAASAQLDLQLLPYCPLPESIFNEDTITIDPTEEEYKFFSYIRRSADNNVQSVVFFLDNNQFSRIIPFTNPYDLSTPYQIKRVNQNTKTRIAAGDYSSAFDFNIAKNGGLSYFKIDCTYKPYSPYIHVQPNFGGLYGGDYNDTRGLICSSTNYSISRLTDAWETYERNNINYENIFKRQIENMDTNRDIQKQYQLVSAFVGAGQAGATLGVIGSSFGAPGAIIGGVAGLVGGGLAGYADYQLIEKQYDENRQYQIDLFNYNNQNVQALPTTLSATGALNPNNKIFPVIEFYDCTEEENEAFINALDFLGFTLGFITKELTNYANNSKFVQGNVIKFNTEIEPQIALELNIELQKGAFIEL